MSQIDIKDASQEIKNQVYKEFIKDAAHKQDFLNRARLGKINTGGNRRIKKEKSS